VLGDRGATGHDIVVIGASAGGVEALSLVAGGLPADLEASVFVVIHVPANGISVLPDILSRRGPLLATHARDGEEFERGRIYVAPPDCHVLLRRDRLRVERGPKENGVRPAIDPLFRSAARLYGPRVVGVILSGVLDDGSAGLAAVKDRGGLTVVQDPEDALYPAMPRNAIEAAEPDEIVPLSLVGTTVAELVRSRASNRRPQIGEEMMADYQELDREATDRPQDGEPSGFSCPECGGVLWQRDENVMTFRCRVGHGFSAETLLAEQSESVEAALWTALRTLEERAAMARRISSRMKARGDKHSASRFERQASEAVAQAMQLRGLLRNLAAVAEAEPAVESEL
jgi:two-component system, chemotaxis family, protein-glutamate methylesterase/glutaminase